MPWHIVPNSSKCPKSQPFAVVKDSDGSVVGCHATRAKAQRQLAALYASEKDGDQSMEVAMTLPPDVVRRLARADIELGERSIPGFSIHRRGSMFEARSTSGRIEIRATQTDSGEKFGLEGYAALWDVEYDVFGGPPLGWTEVVRRQSLTSVMAQDPDIRFLLDHAGVPMARTRSGTLVAATDDVGFRADVNNLDMANPDVQKIRSAVDRGDIDQMSWAFRVSPDGQTWNDDLTYREIVGVKRVYDQSLVTFPANEATFMGRKDKSTKRSEGGLALLRYRLELES